MSEWPDHYVVKCSNSDCALRYPCPAGHERMVECPLCDSIADWLERYEDPHVAPAAQANAGHLVAVLDSIRSAVNVGAMLRSADGVGLDHVHLCGLTARVDNPKVTKTALGAEASVATTSTSDVVDCITALVADGYTIWAMEATPTSSPMASVANRPAKLAFVVGNERAGVDPAVLRSAERHLHLPMGGAKTSLNVGVAFGIAAYGLAKLPLVDPSSKA